MYLPPFMNYPITKRKIDHSFGNRNEKRVLNMEQILKSVKSSSGRQKSEDFIRETEVIFQESLPKLYELNETTEYLIIKIIFSDPPLLSSMQLTELTRSAHPFFVKYDIDFLENAFIFYLVSSTTGTITTHTIRSVETTTIITKSNYGDVIKKSGGENEFIKTVSNDIQGWRNN